MVRVYFPRSGALCEYRDGAWTVTNFVPDPESVISTLTALTESHFPDGAAGESPNADREVGEWMAAQLGGEVRGWISPAKGPPDRVY